MLCLPHTLCVPPLPWCGEIIFPYASCRTDRIFIAIEWVSCLWLFFCLRRQTLGDERVTEAARTAARGASQQQARAAKVAAQRERRRASVADVRYAWIFVLAQWISCVFLLLAECMANAVNSKWSFSYLRVCSQILFLCWSRCCDCYLRTYVGVLHRTTYVVCTSPWHGELLSLVLLAFLTVFE